MVDFRMKNNKHYHTTYLLKIEKPFVLDCTFSGFSQKMSTFKDQAWKTEKMPQYIPPLEQLEAGKFKAIYFLL